MAGLGVVADDVGFAACGFHGVQRFEGGEVGFEPGGHVGPIDADMPGHVLIETGFQGLEKLFAFWRFHSLQITTTRPSARYVPVNRSTRLRLAHLFGKGNDDALRPSDVCQPIRIFVLHFSDDFCPEGLHAGDNFA